MVLNLKQDESPHWDRTNVVAVSPAHAGFPSFHTWEGLSDTCGWPLYWYESNILEGGVKRAMTIAFEDPDFEKYLRTDGIRSIN